MPAAANIQLPRAFGPYDSNGFDDIFEMIFHPPPPPPFSPPFCLPPVRNGLATPFFRGVSLSSVQSLPTEFHIDVGDGERPSSSYIIIEQNIMLADERPAAKMYYDRHNTDATPTRERSTVAIILGTIDNILPLFANHRTRPLRPTLVWLCIKIIYYINTMHDSLWEST